MTDRKINEDRIDLDVNIDTKNSTKELLLRELSEDLRK